MRPGSPSSGTGRPHAPLLPMCLGVSARYGGVELRAEASEALPAYRAYDVRIRLFEQTFDRPVPRVRFLFPSGFVG